ncbi:MAG: SGNH/GDSL hydrolase family protein [Sciscionella sp.]
MNRWSSYLAIGDSFTEGLEDPAPDGGYLGWADRLAAMLAAHSPGLRYGNLAVRGKMMDEIVSEQVPQAVRARPDLVTISAGGNDVITPGSDVDAVVEQFDQAVAALRRAGSDVVVFTGPDTRKTPVLRRVRTKVAVYNCHLWTIANRHGCRMVDLWGMRVLQDPRAWNSDRLHLSPLGHHRVALRAAEVLGVPTVERWNTPWPPAQEPRWLTLRREDLEWTRMYLLPWVRRQLRGESLGDGLLPKRPTLEQLSLSQNGAAAQNGAAQAQEGVSGRQEVARQG